MEVIFELLVSGIIVGVIEDIVVIKVTTEEAISWKTVGIVVLIAVPFAILGEIVFDNIDFASIFKRLFSKQKDEQE